MKTKLLILITAVCFCSPAIAEEHECNTGCPDGKVEATFGDGNNAKCVCVDQGQGHQDYVATESSCNDPDDSGAC